MLQYVTYVKCQRGVKDHVQVVSQEVVEDINIHRILAAAENDLLDPKLQTVSTDKICRELSAFYQSHQVCKNRIVEAEPGKDLQFTSDPALLKYALGHLIRNALEAVDEGGIVRIWSGRDGKRVVFFVHNAGVIPHEVQLQIFQRSYSTKGVGRGLGTYAARMLSEKYLRGKVTFNTSPSDGTTFSASYDNLY